MLSIDLFNSRYEKKLHEGAVDDAIAYLIEPLSRRAMDIRTQLRSRRLDPAQVSKLEKEYEELVQKRLDIILDRKTQTQEQQVPSKQDPFAYVKPEPRGIGDVQDPRQKMAQLNQKAKKGPLANVAAGLKAFIKGEPEPMDEDLAEAAEDSVVSIARYVYAQIMNALESNVQFATIQWPQGTMQGPKQDATLSRNQMHFLIQRLVSMSREQRKQFTQRVLADRVATLQWLTNKKIKPAPTMPQPEIPAGQMDLNLPKPVGEARGQKKNSNKVDSPTAPNAEVQNRLRKLRAQYPSAVNDVEALVQDEMATQARVDQTLGQQQAEIQQQDSALAQLNQVNQQQDSKITSLQQQLATAVRDLQQPATKPTVATSTTATTQPAPVADKPTSVPEPIYIPEPVTAKDEEIYNKVRDLETELGGKIDAMASWNAVAQNDPQANNELEALSKEVERTRTELQRQVKKLKKQVKKHANSLPAIDQAPVRNMGTVRRVATTPQLGQTPTDAGELGRQIGQRAQANKQAKYGKKPTAATPTDLDFLDTDQANQYLSRFARNKQNATTVEPRQAELVEEGTAEQFGQAVRQADQTGRELERDPEWRRLQQQKKQREKNKLRSQAGYGNDADEFGDIIDMNETVKKLQQGDPITVTAPNEFEGATGEIYDFSPSRTFVIVDLYNHGKHSMHLSDVEYNQYAADQDDDEDDWYDDELDEGAMSELDIERQDLDRMTDPQFLKAYGISKEFWKYKNQALLKKPRRRPMSAQLARSPVGQKMNTMYGSNCPGCGRSTNPDRCICESEMKEGWSDAIVARRLGTPRTPYSVYIKGKKWKDFKNDDLARAVADKLKAKFKADGRDPETITIAPTDMSEGITETVTDVKAGMVEIYRRLAPRIERHRDSFLAGQLYDELENYAELHGAEREFKQMMNGARNRAHMEYDTNPGGFHNWFWFLPFADDNMTEGTDDVKKRMSKLEALALAANRAGDDEPPTRPMPDNDPRRLDPGNMEESSKPGEYYIHTVYFKDGTKKRIRVTSDEVDVADYYTKRGKAVDRVDYDFQIHSDVTEGLKSTLAGAALAGAMALGGAGAAQAQSAAGGPSIANATTIIQQIQAGKIQNQNDLASALGNASNKQAVFKILQNKAGLPGHGADSVINALGKKNAAGAQQPAVGAQPTVKSTGQSGSIVQRPTDNFEGRIKEEFDMPGTTIPLKSVIQGFTVFYNPQTRTISVTRGGDSAEAAIEQIRIKQPTILAFKSAVDRLITKIEDDQGITEVEKEPITRQELLNRVDKIQRMMTQERNPANLQIMRKELEMLKQRYQHLKEDNDSEAVERAILNRIMVAHTDLLMKFGPEKVMQAAEEVAYNVGDVDEIGTSDVSAYVHQVKQILGVPEAVNEKWSQKYKSSINCASPKGFSQKAHCAGKKK